MSIVVRIPATSANLGPGFDCLGMALNLYNTVELDVSSTPLDPLVEVRGEGVERLPRNSRNLALRASQHVLSAGGAPYHVKRVLLENLIPVGGGLGSSAAAIVGGMVAANSLLERPFGRETLLQMALEFEPHPDNLAPAFYGGLTVAVLNEAGCPLVATLPTPENLHAVVITPDQSISTHHSRATLPAQIPHADAAFNVGRASLFVAAWLTGRFEFLREAMCDKLHQPYRAAAYPAMLPIIEAALEAGALGAALSGSGPSIIALYDRDGESIAHEMQQAARGAGLSAIIRQLEIVAQGASLLA